VAVELVCVPARGLGEVLDRFDVGGAARRVLGLILVEDPHGPGSEEEIQLTVTGQLVRACACQTRTTLTNLVAASRIAARNGQTAVASRADGV